MTAVVLGAIVVVGIVVAWLSSSGGPSRVGETDQPPTASPLATRSPGPSTPTIASSPTGSPPPPAQADRPRGYLTTPQELRGVVDRSRVNDATRSGIDQLLQLAEEPWRHEFDTDTDCPSADDPEWLDDSEGAPSLYAKAIAFHLTGEERYAEEVRDGLEQIMAEVETIELSEQRCRLVFAWGTPELIGAADLISEHWADDTCLGPDSTVYGEGSIGEGDCRERFGNWLVKNPYYVSSLSGFNAQSNWGAAATNAMATIADYLWDRPDVRLVHRAPEGTGDDEWTEEALSPGQAYEQANRLALDRMNGYRVELHSSDSCDYLDGDQQHPDWPPVKSQITEDGILPDDARRDEFCNVPEYDGSYQNYPQIHLGNLIAQCELMLRRGDSSCYDNVDMTDLPDYTFTGPDGRERTTHLRPGRGSLERAINAVIVDSGTEWRRSSALAVAYRYYSRNGRLGELDAWRPYLTPDPSAWQDLSFGELTHQLIDGDLVALPPTVAPPSDD